MEYHGIPKTFKAANFSDSNIKAPGYSTLRLVTAAASGAAVKHGIPFWIPVGASMAQWKTLDYYGFFVCNMSMG